MPQSRMRLSHSGHLTVIVMTAVLILANNIAQAQPETEESMPTQEHTHTNRLINETSPYLLQHAHNPVDWWPWCEEAIEKARKEDKPIFLSIGYAACHWCHVMEHESFEDEGIAAILNDKFVAIKVDREERPDLDDIYMKAVQVMTGSGGWPMSVFLTPDLKPFFGGTYFPPEDRYGHPGFKRLLTSIAETYRVQRADVDKQAGELTRYITQMSQTAPSDLQPTLLLVDRGCEELAQRFDGREGGFGSAPKFPQPMFLELLMRVYARTGEEKVLHMVRLTLDKMARGGMYDQLGGGFHRYSTDGEWLVPHFEKMLYDNAQLARAYLEAYQLTKDPFYRKIAREILDYVLLEMTSPEGAFYSTTDADSEGEEGKFFVWTPEQVEEVIGKDDAQVVCAYWDVKPGGNFEHGTTILNVPRDASEVAKDLGMTVDELHAVLERARPKLYEAREKRIHPLLDDKILTSWNGLMIDAMAFGSTVLGDAKYAGAAKKAADYILNNMRRDGRLLATARNGEAHLNGYLTDYAFLINGLIGLYEATFENRWLAEAMDLNAVMVKHFKDTGNGGYYFTSDDHEQLIARTKDLYDGAIPSGNSMAAMNFVRLASLTGRDEYRKEADDMFRAFRDNMEQSPVGVSLLLCALEFHLGESREIVIAGDTGSGEGKKTLETLRQAFLPNTVTAYDSGEESVSLMPMLEGKTAIDNKFTVYICQNHTCQQPVFNAADVKKSLVIK